MLLSSPHDSSTLLHGNCVGTKDEVRIVEGLHFELQFHVRWR